MVNITKNQNKHTLTGELFKSQGFIPEGLQQKLTSEVHDSASKWDEENFTDHFYNGNGQTVTLAQTGYLGEIIEKAREVMFHRVEDQVADKMREIKSGKLIYTTENSYPRLKEVFWVFGGGTIRTKTEGIVTKDGDILSITATVDYEYYDEGDDYRKNWNRMFYINTIDYDWTSLDQRYLDLEKEENKKKYEKKLIIKKKNS